MAEQDTLPKNKTLKMKKKTPKKKNPEYKKEEKNAKKEFENSLKKIIEVPNNTLNEFFEPMKEFVGAVALSKGYLNSLFILNRGGLGSTTNVLGKLKELNVEFVYVNNYSTALELVNYIYENREKVMVFDDVESMWSNHKIINVLKGALWGLGKENKRIVSYLTTDSRLKAPAQFEFKGKMLFLINKMPNEKDKSVKALLSRSITYELSFTYKEIMEILKVFSKIDYRELSKKERKEIFDYLKKNTDNTCEELNFRTLIKMYDIYIENKENWKLMCKNLMKRNEKLALLKELLKSSQSTKEAQEKWSEEIYGNKHRGRSSFFLMKKRLK